MKPTHPLPTTLAPPDNNLVNKTSISNEDDHPPDSYPISKEAELDWFLRNAFFQRNYSTKATNNNNIPTSLVPKQLRKSESSIIWIPKTQRKASFPDTKLRRVPQIRLVPKQTDGKTTEPSSPKVSCTGRVRQNKKKSKTDKKKSKKMLTTGDDRRKGSGTLWKKLRDVFRSGKLRAKSNDGETNAARRSGVKASFLNKPQRSLTRFASGRKSDSWIMEMKNAIEEVDNQRGVGIGLWSRRNFEAPEPLDCRRDWLDSGPASV